ncbi:hypothetical protein [Fimbriiglobus ruber]|uniref:Uncharacterized protein n=1 Tax=Fimbriiglobus ruber TaxID=1908690 RepID=A0A225DKU9_9BACT|nr:hypothetical protein [Fimbriiglobus ruber]OWK38086.1 hypothetical protein FRUB_07206 [Fimbriiglobus ruber]
MACSMTEDAPQVDYLFLNTIAFPVRRGVLSRGREELGDYSWELEVYCGESPQLDYQNWPDDRPETIDDLLVGAEPLLSAQRLPLRVRSPDELIGREYLFPPTPEPDLLDGVTAWPFFFLYVWEGCATSQMQVTFTGKQDGRYRVEISGEYFNSGVSYALRVQVWLEWQQPVA